MKMVLAGLGTFGSIWYRLLKTRYPGLQIVVVEADASKKEALADGDAFYCSLDEAIKREQPAFMLNATPPEMHTRLNHIAFDYKLPVLCEKPIADHFAAAVEIAGRAERERIPFMIAENYRWFPVVRRTRELIADGQIGKVTSAHVDFYRVHQTDSPYFFRMENPLLEDIAIHHFDMMRYLFACDGRKVFAQCTNPAGSGYDVNVGLNAFLTFEHDIHVTYTGCFGTKGIQTPWYGSWRIEGTEGALLLSDRLRLISGDRSEWIDAGVGAGTDSSAKTAADSGRNTATGTKTTDERNCLDEFLEALRDKREPEASGRDYLRTQAIVHCASLSHRSGQIVKIDMEGSGGI